MDATDNVTIRFTPLSGGHSLAPPCYLLEVGSAKLLLDCGWSHPFDPELLRPLGRVARDVDAVLITHGNLEHAGGLAYACEKLELACPIYCTFPVKTLGHMAMYDAYLAKHYNGPFSLFSPESIDAAWERLVPLKFSQHLTLEATATASDGEAGTGAPLAIEVTPYAAGHTLGGCVWRIKIGMDEIVYCSHYNHTNERHLQKGLLQTLQRPMLLICGASNALTEHRDKRADRDKQLIESLTTTLRGGGNVLIPTDSSGRVLELALLLDQWWQAQRPSAPGSLVLLSSQAYNMTVAASSLLEWMSERMSKSFQNTADSPFALPMVHRCHSTEDLARVPQPMVVLASMPDLESGFSRELFAHWAPSNKNLVILVDRSLPGTLAYDLARTCTNPNQLLPRTVPMHVSKRIVLAGEELESHRRAKEIERLQALERQRVEEAKKELRDAQDLDEGEEVLAQAAQVLIPENPYFKSAGVYDLVLPVAASEAENGAAAAHPMFPYSLVSITETTDGVGEWSPYGTVVDAAVFNPDKKATSTAKDEVAAAPIEDVPSKIESYDLVIPLNAGVKYVDLEGKSDGKSLKTIIQAMLPRSAIFVRGDSALLEDMKQFAVRELQLTRVHAPDVEQTVDASSDAQIYAAWLKDLLRASLRWQVLDDFEISYVNSRVEGVEVQDKQERRVLGPIEEVEDGDGTDDTTTHRTIFVGQPALKDIKSVLDKAGYRCEFDQGTLVVNECVVVRKEVQTGGNTVLRVEGGFTADFFDVRNIVYGQFKML